MLDIPWSGHCGGPRIFLYGFLIITFVLRRENQVFENYKVMNKGEL